MLKLSEYLTSTKKILNESCPAMVHAVLGNEACDLDSAVSAIAYAFLLHMLQTEEADGSGMMVVPVLNIPRSDYPLRTEVTYWLQRHNIEQQLLVFRNELDLSELHKSSGLRVTLVDHNVLPTADAHLETAVYSVLDHHKRERPHDTGAEGRVMVDMVGSCATLIAQEVFNKEMESKLGTDALALLHGTILLDTVNLSEAAKRVTAKDVEMCQRLERHLPHALPRDVIFEALTDAKRDVSSLTSDQLLRKDVKVATGEGGLKVGVASLPMMVQEYLHRSHISGCLSEHTVTQGYAVLVLMGISIEDKSVRRDLAIYCDSPQREKQLVDHLLEAEGGVLALQETESGLQGCRYFVQGNYAASRKVVLPFIKNWLSKPSL